MTNEMITKNLQIVSLKGIKFSSPSKQITVELKGYAFYNKDFGYLSFKSDNIGKLVNVPYAPKGGKKALQEILNAGGFTSYDDIEWINNILPSPVG